MTTLLRRAIVAMLTVMQELRDIRPVPDYTPEEMRRILRDIQNSPSYRPCGSC